jgi:hypothetical protein
MSSTKVSTVIQPGVFNVMTVCTYDAVEYTNLEQGTPLRVSVIYGAPTLPDSCPCRSLSFFRASYDNILYTLNCLSS